MTDAEIVREFLASAHEAECSDPTCRFGECLDWQRTLAALDRLEQDSARLDWLEAEANFKPLLLHDLASLDRLPCPRGIGLQYYPSAYPASGFILA